LFRCRTAVSTVWKGPVPPQTVVGTSQIGGACGYEFVLGRAYLVYTHATEQGQKRVSVIAQNQRKVLTQNWPRKVAPAGGVGLQRGVRRSPSSCWHYRCPLAAWADTRD
jgi:hypothetical protein